MMRPVIPEVEALAVDERGLVLGLLRGGARDPGASLSGPGADRCRAACLAVRALPPDEAAAARASLAAEVAAPLPSGLARVHPGWVRRALEAETTAVIRAVVCGAPDEIRSVADELLALRDEPAGPPIGGARVAELQRAVFASLAPVPEGASGTPRARSLCELPLAALLDEIDRRGASAVGIALAGAPDAVVARAAAGAGARWARVVLAAAKGPAPREARAEARALVAAAASARDAVRAVGLRALAREVAPEGHAALAAVAQRLPPAVGDALLACAEAP
jgi:hypothetical protein